VRKAVRAARFGSAALLCAFAGGSGAWASGEKPVGERLKGFAAPEARPVKAELIAEHASLQPGGKTRVGVSFDIEEGWHIYAKEPGDAGLPTKIAWSGPRGATFGPLVWPNPQAFIDPGDIKTFGYTGAVLLSSSLSLRSTVKAAVLVKAKAEWLACKEVCVPGSTELELTLPVSDVAPALSNRAPLFQQTG
jgi:thiol:disulfide interchange protein DsbD